METAAGSTLYRTVRPGRGKGEKRPGGQPGHKGHPRKQHIPTEVREIPSPEEYTDDPDYYETGKIIRKQKIVIQMDIKVIEYRTKEYRNRTTGAHVHARFPDGYCTVKTVSISQTPFSHSKTGV